MKSMVISIFEGSLHIFHKDLEKKQCSDVDGLGSSSNLHFLQSLHDTPILDTPFPLLLENNLD